MFLLYYNNIKFAKCLFSIPSELEIHPSKLYVNILSNLCSTVFVEKRIFLHCVFFLDENIINHVFRRKLKVENFSNVLRSSNFLKVLGNFKKS